MSDVAETLNKIVIDPEIQNLCPRLKDDEREQLVANLKRDGWCREPLALWGNVLLDGHNRYEICSEHNIPYKTVEIPGIYNRESAVIWVIANQLGRRNVTPEEKAYLRGKRYMQEKMTPQEAGSLGGAPLVSDTMSDTKPRSAKALAKELGVHEKTVRRAEPFARAVDIIQATVGEAAAREIRDGTSKLTMEKVIEIAEKPRGKQAKLYREAKLEAATPKKPTVQAPVVQTPEKKKFVMPDKKAPTSDGPPDLINEMVRLNAAWPLPWVEKYCVELYAATGDEAESRRSLVKQHLGDLLYKLHCLRGPKKEV